MVRGQAATKANRKPVESQFMAVSETEKYSAAVEDMGAKVSHC
jgi:hypothetical protein